MRSYISLFYIYIPNYCAHKQIPPKEVPQWNRYCYRIIIIIISGSWQFLDVLVVYKSVRVCDLKDTEW